MRVLDRQSGRRYEFDFEHPFRLGYGKDCDLFLDGGPGPAVLLELERARGPVRLSTQVPIEGLGDRIALSVNGKPIEDGVQDLRPGSRLEVFDRATHRGYDLTVEPLPAWGVRASFLATALLVATVIGAGYTAYVFSELRDAELRLTAAETRLRLTEGATHRAERRLEDVARGLATAQLAMEQAMREAKAAHVASQRDLREEFNLRFQAITERTRVTLSQLSDEDMSARQRLSAQTQASIAVLREEVAEKLLSAYQRFKRLEEELAATVASRMEALEPEGEKFKRVLATTTDAVLFVRTDYEAELVSTGETRAFNSIGTGFLLETSGVGVTAQHVLFPWRHETELLVLAELGLARVNEDSVKWSFWTTGEQVMEPSVDAPRVMSENAYRNVLEPRAMHFVYAPPVSFTREVVASPLGFVEVPVPLPGSSDVAVFQLMDFERSFAALELRPRAMRSEQLDDILVVGYPFSRLQQGRSTPQAVRGFIRRADEETIEVDAPIHPGMSGGPIVDRSGKVVGMAVATIGSEVYGMGVVSHILERVIASARRVVLEEEERWRARGCDPGPIDGHIDAAGWQAYLCAASRTSD